MTEPTFAQFIAVNRFLYDALRDDQITTMDGIAGALNITPCSLRKRLLTYRLPRRLKDLRALLSDVNHEMLPPDPLIYQAAMRCKHEDTCLTDQHLELLTPVVAYHFDFIFVVLPLFKCMTSHRYEVLTSAWFANDDPFDYHWDNRFFVAEEAIRFRQTMSETVGRLPDCIRSLTNDQLFRCNADLAVAFLHGSVSFPIPGIASPHLKGTFLLGLRREGTGYLSINSTRASSEIGNERWDELLRWFRENNDLYQDCTPFTPENVDIRLDPIISTGTVLAVEVPGGHQNLTNERQDVFLIIRQADGSTRRKYVPLELALSLTFQRRPCARKPNCCLPAIHIIDVGACSVTSPYFSITLFRISR